MRRGHAAGAVDRRHTALHGHQLFVFAWTLRAGLCFVVAADGVLEFGSLTGRRGRRTVCGVRPNLSTAARRNVGACRDPGIGFVHRSRELADGTSRAAELLPVGKADLMVAGLLVLKRRTLLTRLSLADRMVGHQVVTGHRGNERLGRRSACLCTVTALCKMER